MTEEHSQFIAKIKTYLDSGAAGIKPGAAYRLQQARAAALARMVDGAPESVPTSSLAHALTGSSGRSGRDSTGAWTGRKLLAAVLLIAAVGFGYQQWLVVQQTSEIEEIDAQLLASDLPIDAYLDRGFQTWLTRREP